MIDISEISVTKVDCERTNILYISLSIHITRLQQSQYMDSGLRTFFLL
jgi:hypothetical protein